MGSWQQFSVDKGHHGQQMTMRRTTPGTGAAVGIERKMVFNKNRGRKEGQNSNSS